MAPTHFHIHRFFGGVFAPLIAVALFFIFLIGPSEPGRAQGQSLTALPLTVTPASLDFGGTDAGTQTVSQSVTITNTASYQFPLVISITGPFLITDNTCRSLLAGGATCKVSVAFSPKAPGNFYGTFSFFPAEPSPTVSLRGSAPIPGTTSVSAVVDLASLPDVQPLSPGTPAAPSDAEGETFTTTGPTLATNSASLAASSAPNSSSGSSSDLATLLPSPTFQGLSYVDQGTYASWLCLALSCGPSPPDTQVGVSQSYVVEAVNHAVEIFNKAGNKVMGPKSLYDLLNLKSGSNLSDPIVRYDPGSGRWFILMTTWANDFSTGSVVLAVSNSSDPTASYFIVNEDLPYAPDFPKMAIGANTVVLAADEIVPSGLKGSEFSAFNKSQLTAGSGPISLDYYVPDQGGYHIAPAQPFSPGSTIYMAAVPEGDVSAPVNNLLVWSISGTPGVGNGVSYSVNPDVRLMSTLSPPPMAVQEGTTTMVNTNRKGHGLLDAYSANGFLWASANDSCTPPGDTSPRACLRFIQIDTRTMKETQDFDFRGAGNYYYYPAIRPDSNGDLVAVFTGSSSSEYPSVLAGISLSPSFGSLQQVTFIHPGDSAYTQTTSAGPRWGDYSGAATDPVDGSVWVAGEYSTSLLFNSIWGTWISRIVPPVASRVYVANSGSNSVSVINTATNTVVATISGVNQPGAGPSGIAVTPDGSRVYVPSYHGSGTNAGSQSLVSVINTASDNVVTTIPVGFLTDGIAISPDGTRAYASNECASSTCSLGSSGSVSVIDTAANTVHTTIPVGSAPFGIAVSPDGRRVYVANECGSSSTCSTGSVSVIDTGSNTVVATIPTGSEPFGMAITPDGTRAYVTNFCGYSSACSTSSVSVIATATNTVTATIQVGTRPTGVSITPDGTRAYVANLGSNSVSVINTATNTVVATIPVGSSPVGVGITADGTRAYVSNLGSNSVSVVDIANNTVITTIQVGGAPQGVAARSLP